MDTFPYKKLEKGNYDLSNPYIQSIFTVFNKKNFLKKKQNNNNNRGHVPKVGCSLGLELLLADPKRHYSYKKVSNITIFLILLHCYEC